MHRILFLQVRFYEIIDRHLHLYEAAESRTEKSKIVQTVYEIIASEGRFLKDNAASAGCLVVDNRVAKKKVSHAIRFRLQSGKGPPSSSRKAKSKSAASRSSSSPQPAKRQGNKNIQQQHESQQHSVRPILKQDRIKVTKSGANTKNESSSDCIISDEELLSVLLLPPHEMAMTTRMYEASIWGDQSTEIHPSMSRMLSNDTMEDKFGLGMNENDVRSLSTWK